MATTRVWGARAVTSLLCVAALMGACGGSDDSIGEPAANSESSAANPVAQADGDAEITAATEPTTSAASVPDRVVSSYSLAHGAQDQPGCSAGLVWYNGIPELQAGLAAGDAERVRRTGGDAANSDDRGDRCGDQNTSNEAHCEGSENATEGSTSGARLH